MCLIIPPSLNHLPWLTLLSGNLRRGYLQQVADSPLEYSQRASSQLDLSPPEDLPLECIQRGSFLLECSLLGQCPSASIQ